MRFAGSVSCFTSIAIDRVDLRCSGRTGGTWCEQYASDRSEVFRLQANDVAWPGVACVCKSIQTGHAQRLNMLKQRPRKWFFREEVDFLSSLAFVVRSYDRPPASPNGAIFIKFTLRSLTQVTVSHFVLRLSFYQTHDFFKKCLQSLNRQRFFCFVIFLVHGILQNPLFGEENEKIFPGHSPRTPFLLQTPHKHPHQLRH